MERRKVVNSLLLFLLRHRRAISIILIATAASLAAWGIYRNVWFETILLDPLSGYEGEEPMYIVIEDEVEWRKIWGLATARHVPPPQLPEIDFSTHMVIAVFHPLSGGPAGIRIKGITRGLSGDLTVKVAWYGGPVYPEAIVTAPVHIVKIERMDKEIRPLGSMMISNIMHSTTGFFLVWDFFI